MVFSDNADKDTRLEVGSKVQLVPAQEQNVQAGRATDEDLYPQCNKDLKPHHKTDIQELIQNWDAAERSILEMEAILETMNPREGTPEELHEDLTSMVGRIKKTLDDYKSVYDGLLEFI